MANNNKHTGPNVPALRFPEFSGEWESCTLGDFCDEFQSGKTIKSDSIHSTGLFPVYGGNGLRGYTDSFNHSGEYVLIGRQGALCGNIRFVQGDNYVTEHAIAVRANVDNDTRFLRHLFTNLNLGQYSDQSAQPGLAVNKLVKIPAYAPHFSEQTKIATFLDSLDSRISTQSKIIEEQETLLKSLADNLFHSNNHSCHLSELVDIIKGKQLNADTLSEEGDYYVMNGGITPSGYYSEYNVPAGAISISEGGNSCGYVQFNEEPFWSGGHCYSLRPKTAIVDYKYIYYFLKAKQTDIMALRIGSGLPNIQKKDIEKFTVSFPPLQQQKQFVKALDAVSVKNSTEKRLLEKYRQQKNYLLSRMFI